MQNHLSYTTKRFSLARNLLIPVVITSLCGFAFSSAQAQTTIIQNFESFADTAALNAAISIRPQRHDNSGHYQWRLVEARAHLPGQ